MELARSTYKTSEPSIRLQMSLDSWWGSASLVGKTLHNTSYQTCKETKALNKPFSSFKRSWSLKFLSQFVRKKCHDVRFFLGGKWSNTLHILQLTLKNPCKHPPLSVMKAVHSLGAATCSILGVHCAPDVHCRNLAFGSTEAETLLHLDPGQVLEMVK